MGTLKFKRDILCHDRVPRRPTLAFWSSGDIFWHVRAHRRTVLGYVKVYRRPILARYELIGELYLGTLKFIGGLLWHVGVDSFQCVPLQNIRSGPSSSASFSQRNLEKVFF